MNIFSIISSSIMGRIETPQHLNTTYGDLQSGGMINFISNIVKLIMVLGGLWSLINLILAGFTYITSGDKPDEIKNATNRITYSLLGLVLLVGSIILAGIIGWIFYGNVNALLNPDIYGPK